MTNLFEGAILMFQVMTPVFFFLFPSWVIVFYAVEGKIGKWKALAAVIGFFILWQLIEWLANS